MRGDIFSRLLAMVATRPVAQALDGPAQQTKAVFQLS